MPWTDARDFAAAAARWRNAATLQAALATRMAQHADEQAWTKWVRLISAHAP